MTNEDKLACVERELRLRQRNYPRWIAEGRMSVNEARREIELMGAIVDDYRKLVQPVLFDGV